MLSFADAPGNLFNRLGRLGRLIAFMDSYQSNQNTTIITANTGVLAQLNSEPDIQAIMGASYIGLLNSAGSIGGACQATAAATLNRMIYRDHPLPNQTLQNGSNLANLQELIRQMKVAGASVQSQNIVITDATFYGIGKGVVAYTIKRPSDGLELQNAFSEDLTYTCIRDSYSGGAQAGNEGFSVVGKGIESNPFAFDWPEGSNAAASLNAINGAADTSQGNLLTNSGFDSFDGNTPDNWEIEVGAAGTQVFKETGLVLGTGSAVRILGDGSTLTSIKQGFNSSDGTTSILLPQRQYAVNVFIRGDGVSPAAGVLTVELVDENGTVVQDANGVANSFSTVLPGKLTTIYTGYSAAFRTPIIMPTQTYLRIRLSTALTNSRSLYLDRVGFGFMTQTYTSGPYVAVFSSYPPFVLNDYAIQSVTNNRASDASLSTWQTLFTRLFPNDIINNELLLPSSSTPTISDDLITRAS